MANLVWACLPWMTLSDSGCHSEWVCWFSGFPLLSKTNVFELLFYWWFIWFTVLTLHTLIWPLRFGVKQIDMGPLFPPWRDAKADISSITVWLEFWQIPNAWNANFIISSSWKIWILSTGLTPNFSVSQPHQCCHSVFKTAIFHLVLLTSPLIV